MALDLVRKPWDFDVLVTENKFGDILSDLAAALVGGMGMAPSADIGDKHGLFQPATARPRHRGQGHREPDRDVPVGGDDARLARRAARRRGARRSSAAIERAVDTRLRPSRMVPFEFGGKDGTAAIAARGGIEALRPAP